MKPAIFSTATLLFLGVFFLAPGVVSAQSGDEFEIFQLINRERSKARLSALEWDDRVASVARNYSRQMARENFFDHYDPEGRTVIERAAKLRWSKIGENLFMGDEIPNFEAFAVKGWMRSTTHRNNILDREWNATGIGVYKTNDDRIYVTQVFTSR